MDKVEELNKKYNYLCKQYLYYGQDLIYVEKFVLFNNELSLQIKDSSTIDISLFRYAKFEKELIPFLEKGLNKYLKFTKDLKLMNLQICKK